MYRFYAILFFLTLLCCPLFAQFDGLQFPFSLAELVNEKWEPTKEVILQFDGTDAWFGDAESHSWINQENYEMRNCLDVEGKLIAFTSHRHESTARELSWSGARKMIHGYNCEQLLVDWGDMKMEAWVYRETKQSYIPYIAQAGVTLDYTLTTDNFTKHFQSGPALPLDRSTLPTHPIVEYEKMSFYAFADFMKQRFMPKLADTAPPFQSKTLSGELVEYTGKSDGLLFINFWYTQCPPCIKEIPDLNKLQEKYQNEKIDFLAITFDDAELVQSFLTNHPFDFSIIPKAKKVIKSFDVQVYPTSILINAEGEIIKSVLGGDKKSLSELDTLIQQNLL